MKYFISDIHFSDERIMKLCSRPFDDTIEMDEYIINCWNNKVKATDDVYILGDISKEYSPNIYSQLNGKKHLILGNHDYAFRNELQLSDCFVEVVDIKTIFIYDKKVILCHYPIMDWEDSHLGSIHLYGHIHNKNLPDIKNYYKDKLAFNASADVIGFIPRTLEELIEIKEESL